MAKLISLDEKHYPKATALEIVAGSKLYNIVIDNEKVGKELLSSKLKDKVTLLPLNKINAHTISAQVNLEFDQPCCLSD